MATIFWSTLANGQVLTGFNPASDTLRFDNNLISAAGVVVGAPTTTSTTFSFGGVTVTIPMSLLAVTTTNVSFMNGSLLLVGDNTVATGDNTGGTLNGGAGNDQLIAGG